MKRRELRRLAAARRASAIVRRGGQHPLIIVRRTIWALLALAVAAVILYVRATSRAARRCSACSATSRSRSSSVGVLSIAWAALTFRSEEIVLTNRRIVHARGVINKRATDASLDRITDAVLTEPFFGRVFGYGDLEVRTAAIAGIGRLRMLRGAKGFKTAMLDARHELGLELARPTTPPLRAVPAVASFPVPPSAARDVRRRPTRSSPSCTASPSDAPRARSTRPTSTAAAGSCSRGCERAAGERRAAVPATRPVRYARPVDPPIPRPACSTRPI